MARTVDITRTTLGVLCIAGLLVATVWILKPFLLSLLWASMIVVAAWPLMRGLQARLGGRRGLAVAIMTAALLLVVIAPVLVAVLAVIDNAPEIAAWIRSLATHPLPALPRWIEAVPVLGPWLAGEWSVLAAAGPEGWGGRLAPYATEMGRWMAANVGGLGTMLLRFLLTVVMSSILFARGETAADALKRFARRLAGERGERATILAAQAVRAVALGVGVTALVQSVIGGLGLLVCGVPQVAVLTALMFITGIAQVGAVPVLVPAVIWLYSKGDSVMGTVLLVWTVITGGIDNVIRPVLISKGTDMPLLLIFAGVVGGLVAFGVIGLFVGPVVLAVAHALLKSWIDDVEEPDVHADHSAA